MEMPWKQINEMKLTHKITNRSKKKFEYFSQCEDALRLPKIKYNKNGYTAEECFHAFETWGSLLPCCEPELLTRALNGKEQHGMTVTMIAEDYIDRLIFAIEIERNYPEWVQKDIFGRASQLAQAKIGFIPKFVSEKADFTTREMRPV
jgi:hypothetical protein